MQIETEWNIGFILTRHYVLRNIPLSASREQLPEVANHRFAGLIVILTQNVCYWIIYCLPAEQTLKNADCQTITHLKPGKLNERRTVEMSNLIAFSPLLGIDLMVEQEISHTLTMAPLR
jgi:hypothetical protein